MVWLRVRHKVLLCGCLLAAVLGCTKNPSGVVARDGRLYVQIDVPVGAADARLLFLDIRVEGYDQLFKYKIFDYRNEQYAIDRGMDIEGAYEWSEVIGRPVDYLDMMLPGGTEVIVQVKDAAVYRGHESLTFRIDGNAGVRSYMTESGRYELERLY